MCQRQRRKSLLPTLSCDKSLIFVRKANTGTPHSPPGMELLCPSGGDGDLPLPSFCTRLLITCCQLPWGHRARLPAPRAPQSWHRRSLPSLSLSAPPLGLGQPFGITAKVNEPSRRLPSAGCPSDLFPAARPFSPPSSALGLFFPTTSCLGKRGFLSPLLSLSPPPHLPFSREKSGGADGAGRGERGGVAVGGWGGGGEGEGRGKEGRLQKTAGGPGERRQCWMRGGRGGKQRSRPGSSRSSACGCPWRREASPVEAGRAGGREGRQAAASGLTDAPGSSAPKGAERRGRLA